MMMMMIKAFYKTVDFANGGESLYLCDHDNFCLSPRHHHDYDHDDDHDDDNHFFYHDHDHGDESI